jgi:hypothetical protein
MNQTKRHRSSVLERMIFDVLTLAVFSALLLIAARPAQAQTETVLYNFTGEGSGAYDSNSRLTPDSAGNFYGTNRDGGLRGSGPYLSFRPTAAEAGMRSCSRASALLRTARMERIQLTLT